jgi:histone H3/H4
MAAKKKAGGKKASGGSDAMIISKSRVKAAAKKSNVGSEFYGALEQHVRQVIAAAESRAAANGRKTLRPQDV